MIIKKYENARIMNFYTDLKKAIFFKEYAERNRKSMSDIFNELIKELMLKDQIDELNKKK
jgi:hypothetical protein